MSLPKGWKKPQEKTEFSQSSKMPRLSHLSRPMVGLQSLRIKGYSVKKIEQIDLATNQPTQTGDIKYFEVQPIELTHALIFTNGRSTQATGGFGMQDIVDIKIGSILKGTFSKKEDLILEMKVLTLDKKPYLIKIDVEDQYADEIVKDILSSKNIENDAMYWTHRTLNFTNQYGQKNSIDIYPVTPFLAMGEEILWQIQRFDINDKNKKVIWIDVITNYRVFQYDYVEHKGAAILFPSLEDVKINNEGRGDGFGEYNASSPHISGIQSSGAVAVVGDVVFYVQGSPWITFNRVNDPETLLMVIKTLNNQQANTIIGNGEAESKNVEQSQRNVPNQLSCTKCGNNENPVGSKFCNNCGSSLSPVCPNCGNSSPSGSLFCGQCGTKLV